MTLRLIVAILLFLGSVQFVPAQERSATPPMVNGDVVKLVKGGLSKELIIHTIESRPNHFDLSADALLDLKKKGVPDDVIQAMVSPKTEPASSKAFAQSQDEEDDYLWLYDGTKKIHMEMAHTGMATKVGFLRSLIGLGYGYITLPESGPAAAIRVTNKNPSFGEMNLPLDRRIEEVVYLVKFEIDPDTKRRSVQIAKSSLFTGDEIGFPQEVRIPVVFTEIREATINGIRQRVYRMAPATPLEPGEYAIAFDSGARFLDFGIDP